MVANIPAYLGYCQYISYYVVSVSPRFSCDTTTSYRKQLSCFMYQVHSNWCVCSTLLSLLHLLYFRWIKIYYVFSVSYKSVAFLWLLTHWYHRDLSFNMRYFGYSLTSGEEREIIFPHFNCNISVVKTCAILWLTHFATHCYPHIWFCTTYTYFWFNICICWIWCYLSCFAWFITDNYSSWSRLLIHIPSLQLLSCLVAEIHWFFCACIDMFNTIFHERCEINVAQEEACMCC